MAHRNFDLIPMRADPPTFNVAGREFKCLPEPPAGVLTDLVSLADGSIGTQAAGVVAFIGGCLSDADAEQFELLVHSKDTVVPLGTLLAIAEWLVEEYTGRPTTPSSSSQSGATPASATSGDGALQGVSIPARSGSSD